VQQSIAAAIVRIDLNLPPERRDAERPAGVRGSGRTGLFELGVGAIEPGREDGIVHEREFLGAGQRRFGGRGKHEKKNRREPRAASPEARATWWCDVAAFQHAVRWRAQSGGREARGRRGRSRPTSWNTSRSW